MVSLSSHPSSIRSLSFYPFSVSLVPAGSRPPYHRSRSNLSATSSASGSGAASKIRRAQSHSAVPHTDDAIARDLPPSHARSSSVPKPMDMSSMPAVPPMPAAYKSASSHAVAAVDAYPTPPTSVSKDNVARGRVREVARLSESASGALAAAAAGPPSAFNMPVSSSSSSGKLRKARPNSQKAAARQSVGS